MSKLIVAGGILCAALLAGCGGRSNCEAVKTGAPAGVEPCYPTEKVKLDANCDGKVSAAEAKHYYAEEFRWFDVDGDGKISVNEVVSTPDQKKLIDANGDGIVTQEEYLAYWVKNPVLCGEGCS